jgi:hypothetical protein
MAHAEQLMPTEVASSSSSALPAEPVPATELPTEHSSAARVVAAASAAEPPQEDLAVTRARGVFIAFQALLQSGQALDPAVAERVLSELLAAARQLNLTMQNELEFAIASSLAAAIPRSDGVLRFAAERFGWSGTSYRQNDEAVSAILGRLAALEFETQLAAGTHPLSAAYAVLKQPPRPVFARLRAIFTRLDASMQQLLIAIRFEHPTLEKSLNAASVAWWTRYFEGTRVTLSTLAGSLIAALMLWYASAGDSVGPLGFPKLTWVWLMFVCAATTLFAGSVLARIQAAWPAQWRVGFWIGWFPVTLGLVLVSGLVPAVVSFYLLFPIATLAIPWAWKTERRFYPGGSFGAVVTAVFWRVVLNIVMLALIGVLFIKRQDPGPVLTLLVAVIAHSCGYATLAQVWRTWSRRHKDIGRIVVAGVAILALAALWATDLHPASILLLAAAVVLLHRPIVAAMSEGVLRARQLILWLPFVALSSKMFSDSEAREWGVDSAQIMATWFLGGVLLGLLLSSVTEEPD